MNDRALARMYAPRDWAVLVRGGVPPDESAVVLRRVYGAWLVALGLKALGANWDVSWHFTWLRDLAPPHLINTVGTMLMCALVVFHSETRFGVDRAALRMMRVGTVMFLVSVPIDVINHRVNGLDMPPEPARLTPISS